MSQPTDRPKTLGDMPIGVLAEIAKSVTALPIAHRFSRCSRDTLTTSLSNCTTLVLYIDAYSGFLKLSTAEAFRTRAEPVVLVLKRRGLWPKSDFSERLDNMIEDLGTCPAVHTVHLKGEIDVLRNTDLESWQDLLSTNLPNCTALKVSMQLVNIQHLTRLLSHSAIAQRLTHLDLTTTSWVGDNNSGLSAFVKSTLNLRSLHIPTLDDLEDSLAEQQVVEGNVCNEVSIFIDTMYIGGVERIMEDVFPLHVKFNGPNLPFPTPSPAQPSPAQPSPAQPSPAQPSPAQPSPAQPSPAQPSPAQPSPAQPSPAQPSPAQPSPAQPSPAQPSPAQPSPAQPSPAQPSPAQPSPAQPSPAQPSPAQPSPAQPSPAQPSPAQPSPAQPSPAQPSPAQPSPAQPSPPLPPPPPPPPSPYHKKQAHGAQEQPGAAAMEALPGRYRSGASKE
ncbi:hypothetical protein V8C86DRAFT_3133736 [Haematococcus lacustris]